MKTNTEEKDPTSEREPAQTEEREAPDDDQPEVRVKTEDDGGSSIHVDRESRRERRQRGYDERVRGIVGEQTRALQDELRQMRESLGAVLSLSQQQQRPAPRDPAQPVDLKQQWRDIRKQQSETQKLMQNARTEQEIKDLEERWYDLDFQQARLVAAQEAQEVGKKLKSELPQQEEPSELRQLKREFGDVFKDPEALNYAGSLFVQAKIRAEREVRMGRARFVDEMKLHRESLAAAAEEFDIRKPSIPEPKRNEQIAAFSGDSSSSNGRSGPPPAIRLTPQQRGLAIAFGVGNGAQSEEEAISMWTKTVMRADPKVFSR